jgi:hypothetical protein
LSRVNKKKVMLPLRILSPEGRWIYYGGRRHKDYLKMGKMPFPRGLIKRGAHIRCNSTKNTPSYQISNEPTTKAISFVYIKSKNEPDDKRESTVRGADESGGKM